ncbi:helix-turn-helix transcriptional regulator [Stenotrophomonas maltophilia]|uniref:helix-turn-helix domain-containing protein n=1 Tax=Stenotrophomonas maltophilia TaxID=40324 RepID=UPI0006AC7E69|nr:helix-turn-helix transcriptional regulator [Stenotrophomonas maltophilia]KOQ71566.1 hypothetical protein ABW43_00145 [Stenotrophomonas maltophilia]MBN4937083.1 helix-turn-helix transcriptional regulator [Stenotrophomonas maltophilia]
MSTPGQRLREERTRLGLTQEAFGALGGVRKQAQIKYEKGERKPDSSYFEGIAAAGADIDYVLTGTPRALRERLQNVKLSTELGAALGASKDEIRETAAALYSAMEAVRATSDEERALLENFRRCTPDDRVVLLQMAARFAVEPASTPKSKNKPD